MKQDNRIRVTDLETGLASQFTAGTLAFLRARNPGVRFVWLMGADCLAEFHRWRHWREIFATLPVAVIDRPGFHFRGLAAPAARTYQAARVPEQRARTIVAGQLPAWTFLSGPLSPMSSTALRHGLEPSRQRRE